MGLGTKQEKQQTRLQGNPATSETGIPPTPIVLLLGPFGGDPGYPLL